VDRAWRKNLQKIKGKSGLNTNMHLERMQGVIKHIYLKGKKPRRVDIAINALMRFLRDKLSDKLISNHKGKLTSKHTVLEIIYKVPSRKALGYRN